MTDQPEYDFDKVYDYQDFPDKASGRCDNCGKAHFKSSVKDYVFIRECSNCGLKKSI
ncbi:hypothetical protein [Sporosarcina globispora]|uniref:hypothetical protein n=1 Tax=Sporosarcina globispora TaxID=1459 RepID=UPI00146FEBC1|nr:hypothetical protein [Sporosarcina globispora]